MKNIRLTQYSRGAGCGCKLSPEILQKLVQEKNPIMDPLLLVGSNTSDDAAVYDLGDGKAIISTTDFFTPIVDDPASFGHISAVNSISDIYAMGGTPLVAIAILGWPVDKLEPEIARVVLDGGRTVAQKAGIQIAGGHSIDNPDPIFGLAVTGIVAKKHLKRNNTAKPGSTLYLTKPIGTGLISTAQKQGMAQEKDIAEIIKSMMQLNKQGEAFGKLKYVNAMTDVTGFGLLGHLVEMCAGSQLTAELKADSVPTFTNVPNYIKKNTTPGGTFRNWKSYGHKISTITEEQVLILADPQTSGGLLVSVDHGFEDTFELVTVQMGLKLKPIGKLIEQSEKIVHVI